MLSSPFYHFDSGVLSSRITLDVDQEPAGPKVYLMSMSLTTEPSKDGPTVSEGLIYPYFLTYISLSFVLVPQGVCQRVKE